MFYRRTTRRVVDDPLAGTQPIAGIKKATQAAQQAATTASENAAGYGEKAEGIGGELVPELQADAKNPQGFKPSQVNSMLTEGLEGAGGAAGGIAGEAGLKAARSRNAGAGETGVLDEAAREKIRASAGVGLNVATKNAMLQQQQRASALKQLEGMYNTDVGAQAKNESLVPENIDAWSKANQTGWMQNTAMMIDALKPHGGTGGEGFGFG